MQTVDSSNHPPVKEAFIHRHCMQKLLHEAISREKKHCCGLLAGRGNIVTSSISVTDKLFATAVSASDDSREEVILGAYLATDADGQIDLKSLAKMKEVAFQDEHQAVFFCLVLYLGHKGRVDAHMYTDLELNVSVPLNMQECSE